MAVATSHAATYPVDDTGRLFETALCITTHKGSADAGRLFNNGNPLDQMMAFPTSCVLTGLGALERRDGIKGLMANGWRPTSVSHQLMPMTVAQPGGDKLEILLSLVVILQRVSPLPAGVTR